jgi:hypothetical protein
MSYAFEYAGFSCKEFVITGFTSWDVSNVRTMSWMFSYAGAKATTFSIDLSHWNVASVDSMERMFDYAGFKATSWSIGNVSNWKVSNVTTMAGMFAAAGANANFTLDLRSWNVSNVTHHEYFEEDVEKQIIAPSWKR